MTNYIKNLETGKIELHFDKAEYIALTEAQKADLKSAFLWSNYGKCWVSRSKEPNTYHAIRTAEKLGFVGCEKTGERISFAEQLARKAEKAEARADRYEEYAGNAIKRSAALTKPLESMRGDIAFFTQPIIAGHAGSQAFARARQRMYDKFDRGMEEYRKSEHYQDRAATARATASMKQLEDPVYLDNRVRECNKNLRDLQKHIVTLEETIYKLQQGETLRSAYSGNILTLESQEERLEEILDRYEVQQEKLDFFEDCINKIGGIKFSRENVKVGYVVKIRGYNREVLSAGPVNVTCKIVDGGARGMVLTSPYAEITEIVTIAKQKAPEIVNPYKAGDVLTANRSADSSIYRAFQVLKATEKSVNLQEIAVVNGIPQLGQFKPGSKPERKGITKSKYSDFVGVYMDNWQLYKYTA